MAKQSLAAIPSVDDMSAAIDAMKAKIEADPALAHELIEGHTSGNPMVLGPRLPSPEDWAKLQVKGSQDNAQKWLERTTKPRKNFQAEALKPTSQERYKNSMERVLRDGTYAGGMAQVNVDETIAIIQKRGASPYSQGVADRAPKIERRVKELHSDRLALAATVDQMPVATDADREAKVIANMRGLKAIGQRRRKM